MKKKKYKIVWQTVWRMDEWTYSMKITFIWRGINSLILCYVSTITIRNTIEIVVLIVELSRWTYQIVVDRF